MKSGATETSYVFLKEYMNFPDDVEVSHIPKDLYNSKKKVKILWAHHACDQYVYLNFNHSKIDKIVCPSQWARDLFIKHLKVPEYKLVVIHNGYNKIFSYSSRKTKTFIYTGIPYKGLELFPQIFSKVLEKHPDARLKIFSCMGLYGQTDTNEKLYDTLRSIPNVEYHSSVDQSELVSHYQESAFFLHPNIWEETFCVSMVEAMACGCHPIISNIGAIPEISQGYATIVPISGIRTSEKYIVDDTFIDKFAEACISACDFFDKNVDKYTKLSFITAKKVRECYNWKKITEDWKNVMEKNERLEIITADEAIKEESYLEHAIDNVLKWTEDEKELAQTRSNFQIEKFIVLGNYTIPAAVHQILRERRVSAEAYVELLITMKEKSREFEHRWKDNDKSQPVESKTAEGGYKQHWFDLDQYRLYIFLKSSELEIRDRIQQMETLDKILISLYEKNGGPVSREQFESEDHIYWERRFADQMFDEIVSKNSGISEGNLHSVRRALAPTIGDDDTNRIKNSMPDLTLALNPETAPNFVAELQQKILAGVEELTDKKVSLPQPKEEQPKIGADLDFFKKFKEE
jgi:glycosyltransferase involved in cell wall biosynthesis|tara:strand:- start:612 stop:2339 length:1728 start_codon:yes stop_codon:yes gene_type:complete